MSTPPILRRLTTGITPAVAAIRKCRRGGTVSQIWVSLLLRRFMNAEYFEKQRRDMLAAVRAMSAHRTAEAGKTALDERVLRAMAKVPRHEFVPFEVQQYAYLNRPIPIGFDKTISQPLMVAVMTDLLELKPEDMVLEIGTGLGYQAAVLAKLAGRGYSVEI